MKASNRPRMKFATVINRLKNLNFVCLNDMEEYKLRKDSMGYSKTKNKLYNVILAYCTVLEEFGERAHKKYNWHIDILERFGFGEK
jgi:hypothetical protein